MHITIQKGITDLQKASVLKLWNEEYPQKLQYASVAEFDKYLDGLEDKTHFLLREDEEIIGWAATFKRDEQRWFAILISSVVQGKGYGKKLLNALKEHETHLLGWVIDHNKDSKANGMPYCSPLVFYEKNGFVIQPEIRFESEKMSALRIEWKKIASV
ncbi:GNAT family N-acetyltransferase [Xanthocytophaga agilis]|uniref:GNAT family N-acetyltransferase n=1 Tax=Xanthocytophaga agilis TaxID=3048010 RepID=A0AAE3UJI8_9BACT|nr:GNAT family N-acetyltransferase [Xanthocytophaga agilis]MDJ1506896.1 GNAT family N-acetyltransferase [Xanthocytophaga agilis]